jgi:hypothetical protein
MAGEELEASQATPEGMLAESDFSTGGEPQATPAAAPPTQTTSPLGGQPQQPAAQPEPPTIRGLVSGMGYQFGDDVTDDYGALVHLAQQAVRAQQLAEMQRQGDVFAQLGRQLAPRAREIGQFLQGQQQPPQRAAYEPPPFDERWARLLRVDEQSGRYVPQHPSVPQEIVDAANDYAEYTQNFLRNPVGLINQVIEASNKTMDTRIQEAVQAGIRQYQVQQQVNTIAHQNAGWFYARDPQGQFMPDAVSGGWRVSPLGQQYLEAVRWAASAGVQDPVHRDEFARRALRAEIAQAQQATQQPMSNQAVAQARQERALPGSRPMMNPLQSLSREQRAETPGATEPVPRKSFSDLMRENMAAEGITDQHLLAEGAFLG